MDTFCKLDGPDLLSHMMDLGQIWPIYILNGKIYLQLWTDGAM